jgi:hypothetical protein
MFQSGRQTISNSATTVTVTYPIAFVAAPALVLPTISNTTDGTPLALACTITSVTASGFTVKLSQAANSANYELVWAAGDERATLAIFNSLSARSVASFPATGDMRSPFLLPCLATSPVSGLKPVSSDTFWNAVPQVAARPPSFAGDAVNVPVALHVDELGGYLYISGGSKWMRVAVDGSGNWSATSFFVPFREGFITLEPDGSETEFDITFAKAFTSGNAPVVDFSLQIPDGETEPTLLSAMLKGDTTLTGFTLLFSAPLTHNVRVNYMARQLNGTHGGGAPALVFNSPTFTGTPTAPTASPGTNTTQLATTAFVSAAIAALLDSAPSALNTLNELAAALGDDANFASTITSLIAGKADAAHTHSNATTGAAGFMSATDKTKLDGLSNYTLPVAGLTTIGGVKRNAGTSGQYVSGIDSSGNLVYGTPAGGATVTTPKIYYVASNGDDTTGDGKITNPYLTGTKAFAVAVVAGLPAHIHFGVGVFACEPTGDWPSTLSVSGCGIQSTTLNITTSYNVDLTSDLSLRADISAVAPEATRGPSITARHVVGTAYSRGGDGSAGSEGTPGDEMSISGDGGTGGTGGDGGSIVLLNCFMDYANTEPGAGGPGGPPGTDGGAGQGMSGGGGASGSRGTVSILKGHVGYLYCLYYDAGGCNISNVAEGTLVNDYGGTSTMPQITI